MPKHVDAANAFRQSSFDSGRLLLAPGISTLTWQRRPGTSELTWLMRRHRATPHLKRGCSYHTNTLRWEGVCRNPWLPQTRFVKAPLRLNALARAGGLDADLAKAPEDLRAPTASAACTSCAKGKWSA